jgi:hypothetical protein
MRQDDVRALKEKRVDLVARMRGMVDDAERRGRDMTSSEQAQFNRLERDARRIGIELEGADDGDPRPHLGATSGDTAATEPLYAEFRRAGFALREPAEIDWNQYLEAEHRAFTWTGSIANLAPERQTAGGLGYDQRWAYPILPQTSVESDTTAIQVLTQTARTLASPGNVVRAIDSVTAKPETASTMTLTSVDLKQVASVVSDVPNVIVENERATSVIAVDLRYSINDGLDSLLSAAVGASGFEAPSTNPLLVSLRNAAATIQGAGYNPTHAVLTPNAKRDLDVLRATATAGEQFYVWSAGGLSPDRLFGMQVRVSKVAAAPYVIDASAFGRMYASPVRLQTFEQDAGQTNKSRIRMELHAAVGVERQAAAVRIAAS